MLFCMLFYSYPRLTVRIRTDPLSPLPLHYIGPNILSLEDILFSLIVQDRLPSLAMLPQYNAASHATAHPYPHRLPHTGARASVSSIGIPIPSLKSQLGPILHCSNISSYIPSQLTIYSRISYLLVSRLVCIFDAYLSL